MQRAKMRSCALPLSIRACLEIPRILHIVLSAIGGQYLPLPVILAPLRTQAQAQLYLLLVTLGIPLVRVDLDEG
jgi:hypothetical protein